MAGGKIYLREIDRLVAMAEAPYDAEHVLQELLAHYPDLLAGEQMRPREPRRWLLIGREAGIPDTDGGPARWSIDHLFIDQDAIPTLVEVKRSSDTRLRREVVGQMLDYAANVAAYWQGSELRHLFDDRDRPGGGTGDDEVLRLLELEAPEHTSAANAVDEFWQRAAANLAARQMRLVFVADVIPPELQRIVEFLNENLVRAEVLAVEVKQYVGEGRQTLVPRVIGRTAAAEDVKQASGGAARVTRAWTEAQFLEATAETGGPNAHRLASEILEWNRRYGVPILFGKGKFGPLYLQPRAASGELVKVANMNTQGYVAIGYDWLVKFPPFDAAEQRVEVNRRLNSIPGVQIPERAAVDASWPGIDPKVFASEAARARFLKVFDWVALQLANAAQQANK